MPTLLEPMIEALHIAGDNYSHLDVRDVDLSFEFERIDSHYWGRFMVSTWWAPLLTSIVYLVLIFGLEKFMENRKPYDLRTPLIWWNAGLGLFSIIGFVRCSPAFFTYFYSLDGLYVSLCTAEKIDLRMAYWTLLFGISKFVELGDTLFIVLRKRPLQLLQWYHHIATLTLVWLSVPWAEPIGKWLLVMNYGVHGVMYPYFALKMAGVHVPKIIANMITTAQLTQMILGVVLNIFTIAAPGFGVSCYRTQSGIILTLSVYSTFLILFGKLFYNSVLNPSKERGKAKKTL